MHVVSARQACLAAPALALGLESVGPTLPAAVRRAATVAVSAGAAVPVAAKRAAPAAAG